MRLLTIFVLVGSLPVLVVLWRVANRFRELGKIAASDEAFKMRRGSMSPTEWRQWNAEFFTINILKVPLLFALGEGFLLATILKRPELLAGLCVFLLVLQSLPTAMTYCAQLWLMFRYGRFHLERFDPHQEMGQQIATAFFLMSAWFPIAGTWLYVVVIFPPQVLPALTSLSF